MQARILAASLSAIAVFALSTGAAAQQRVSSGGAEQQTSVQGPYQLQAPAPARQRGQSAPAPRDPEQPVCGHCGSDVQAQPSQAGADFIIRLPGVEGESSPPPPPPPPPRSGSSAPSEQLSLNYERLQTASPSTGDVAPPQEGQAALLVPAIQRARDDGHAAPAPNDPELPICGHCGAEAQAQPSAAAPQRRRGGFSLSIGGVTIGSGGVNVAVGDVNGDGAQSAGRQTRPARPASAPSAR